jgi:hypothetical protein
LADHNSFNESLIPVPAFTPLLSRYTGMGVAEYILQDQQGIIKFFMLYCTRCGSSLQGLTRNFSGG